MSDVEADALARCIRPGRQFPRHGLQHGGWWCVLHQPPLSRHDAVEAVVRACAQAMRAGATGPELMEAYRQAERQQQQLEGVGG